MKRIFTVLFCLSVLFLSGCNRSSNVQNNGKKTLGLSISTMNNPFFVELVNGAKEEAKALGYNLIVLDSQDDPAKELTNVESLCTSCVSVILVNPTDSDSVVSSVEYANNQNIPVITLDRRANGGNVAAAVESDNVKGGYLAGDFIKNKLGNKAVIAELEGIPGTSAARNRGQGFEKAVAGMKVVAKLTADFDRAKGMTVMENMLQAHPEINAVFAQNDEMALGAVEAIKNSGKKIIVVGFDATDDGLKAVKDGSMSATVAQDPSLIGRTGIRVADKIVQKIPFEKENPVSLKLITDEYKTN